MEANAKHPSLVPPRDLQTLSADMDWTANGKTTTMVPIGMDVTPSMGYVHSFRGGPDLEPDADFHRTANTDAGLVGLEAGGMEANAKHPSLVAPRDFEAISAEQDWAANGKTTTMVPIGIDTTPSMGYVHSFRGGPDLKAHDDFQRVASTDSGTVPLPFGDAPNKIHPSTVAPRDFDTDFGDLDWQLPGVKSSTYRAQAGFEPNRTHPSLMNARELEKMDAGMDWQQGGNGNQLITRTK